VEKSKEPSTSSITIVQLKNLMQEQSSLIILDVRRAPAFEKNPVLIKGAQRVPPETVTSWAQAREFKDSKIIVYCVYGHEVSQGAVQTLRQLGQDAFFVEGGLAAWEQCGGAVSDA
jgi:thiosulfate sulfurtransferase